jgi:single-stranded DNA-binding protein
MLSVLLSGRLVGSDPTQKVGASGKAFTVAKVVFQQDGDEPGFANVIAFGSAAEQLLRLKKGDDVAIAGRAGVQAWADRTTGEARAGLRMVAEHVLTPYAIKQRRKPATEDDTQGQQ